MKTNDNNLRRRIGWWLVGLLLPLCLHAQEDSLRIRLDSLRAVPAYGPLTEGITLQPATEAYAGPAADEPLTADTLARFPMELPSLMLPYAVNPTFLLQGDYRTDGYWTPVNGLTFMASGQQTTMPGLGRFNEAALGMDYALGSRLSLQATAALTRMNMARYTGQAFGVSGSMRYRVSDRMAFRVFGGYGNGHPYATYYSHYGASALVEMSDRFGMEMGVQRIYDPVTGQWRTQPVVAPHYRFNKMTIGMDVGGLLQDLLFHFVGNKGRRSPATIGPPRPKR